MMTFEKVYDEFVKYTGLSDSVYRSVFSNVFEVLNKLKTISWDYLEYKDSSGGSTSFVFSQMQKIPRYVVELFQNVFKNYYTLPANSEVILCVTVDNIQYKILNSSEGTVLPKEIEFIKKHNLYDIFILGNPVYDLFSEFDSVFSFVQNFKSSVHDVFLPLKKKFELDAANEFVNVSGVSQSKLADTQLNVEGIQNRIKELLERVDFLRKERDQLIISRNKIFIGVNSRESLLLDRDKYSMECETLRETKKTYEDKLDKLTSILNTIEADIADAEIKQIKNSDIDYLVKKKVIFEKDKFSIAKSISDFDGFITDLSGKLKIITENLESINEYSTNDVETLDSKVASLNAEQDNLYGILIGLESELKHQKRLLEDSAMSIEKSKTYSDISIQNIENSAIVNHLASALHPTPVTTVINYLRYYFAYHATQIANSILSENSNMDTYLAQAVAVKLTLVRNFGIYLSQIFSAVDFADNRIEKTLIIVKE